MWAAAHMWPRHYRTLTKKANQLKTSTLMPYKINRTNWIEKEENKDE